MIYQAREFGVDPTSKRPRVIPNPSKVTIDALPERRTVYKAVVTGGEVTTDLPPGKYAMCVLGMFRGRRSSKQVRCHYVVEFLHGLTEEQWEAVQHLHPRMAECVITSEGTVFTCRFCRRQSKHRLEAAMHECVHYGVNPLDVDADAKMQDATPHIPKGFAPPPLPSLNPLTDAIPAPVPSRFDEPPSLASLEELP
jgi:hypothetical protein